ncbi:MAG: hypothetical protein HY363_00035 [Candidatus Aenigmarchaeota archaeon]|nr:hypothetical protein [Candidatus Aenigmarchaeota archaeon]
MATTDNMQNFIVTYNDQIVHSEYPDKKDAEVLETYVNELLQQEVSQFPAQWLEAKSMIKQGRQDKCIPLLDELVKSFPDSYILHLAFGELLQSLGIFHHSVREFYLACANADHAFFKLQSTSRKMLSLKQLGDYFSANNCHTSGAMQYFEALDAYYDAYNWNFAATCAEAVSLQYTYASLFCSILELSLKSSAKDLSVSTALLNKTRAAKELSVQIADYYDATEINEQHEALEKSLQTFEAKILSVK